MQYLTSAAKTLRRLSVQAVKEAWPSAEVQKKGGRGVGVLPRVTVRMPVLGRTRMIWGQASVVAGDPVKRVRERLAVLKGIVMSDVQGVSTPAEFPDRHPTKGD